jgi:mannose/fructose-specific phosphotransferase system component IIA
VETPDFISQVDQDCDEPDPDDDEDLVLSVDSIGGVPWNLSFTLVRTESPPAVAITNISLEPA